MKTNLVALSFLAIFSTPLYAQSNNIVERGIACSVKDGYTINDVVSLMKGFEWPDETAPGVVMLREAVAAPGDFQFDWDFVMNFYYPSWIDMAEKRSAFRNRTGGSDGIRLRDVAVCGERVRMSNVWLGLEDADPLPDVAPSITLNCQLNGLGVSDAIANAGNVRNLLGPDVRQSYVISRAFGGPSMVQNSQVSYRASFNSSEGFAETMDRMSDNPPRVNPDNPQECNVGGLWIDYLIYARNN